VVFDTGSSEILIPTIGCKGCDAKAARFNPQKSTTFSGTERPWIVQFATGVGVGVGSKATPWVSGTRAVDVVTVAGVSSSKQAINLISQQSPNFFEGLEIDGIVGMASAGNGFMKQLIQSKLVEKAVFSMAMTPKAINKAQLTIGGIDELKIKGPINYMPVSSARGSWNISFQSVTVNGQDSGIRAQSTIADSGTSNMIAPARDAKAIYAMISPKIKMIDPKGAYGLPCSEAKGLKAEITFMMQGKRYTIPSSELVVGKYPGQPGMCQTLINSGSTPFWIFGGSLMKYYYTVWDIGGRRMGWAETQHSPATSVSKVNLRYQRK
jgi:hypothetical protein